MAEWSDKSILQLRELWTEGHSTAEIGRRLGMSKNAVVGKAHRLDLPPRPSPITRITGEPRSHSRVQRASRNTLPPLPSHDAAPPPRQLPYQPPPRPTAPPPPPKYGRTVPCSWPIGDPGTPGFRFCDAVSDPGKPYCTEHARLAYVRIRHDDGEEKANA